MHKIFVNNRHTPPVGKQLKATPKDDDNPHHHQCLQESIQ